MLTLAKIGRCQASRRRYRGLGNPDCQGPVVEGGEPRRRQDLQQDGPCANWPSWPRASIGSCISRRSASRTSSELVVAQPSYFTAMAEDARQSPAGHLEGVAEVPCRPSLRGPAEQGVGRRGIRVLRHDPPRRSAKTAPAGSGASAPWKAAWARRWASCTSRSGSRPRPSSGWTRWSRTSWRPIAVSFENLDWMSPADQAKGPGEAGHVHAQDRLSRRSGATIRPGDPPRRPGGQRRSHGDLRVEPRPGQARQAGRSRRMAHDPADGQRLLQSQPERDRLPGRHPAAALLQPRRPTMP